MGLLEQQMYAGRMLAWFVPMIRHLRATADQGVARYFRDPELRKLFGWQDRFISMLMPVAWASTGNYHIPPRGGSRTLVEWLCRQIKASGSEVFLNRRVSRVAVNDRRQATGVVLETGQTVQARHVISAGNLQTLYDEMLPADSVPKRLQTAVRTADLYYSNFTVFIGLDCDSAALGFGEEMLYLTRDDVPRAEQFSGDPAKTTITVLAPSVRDPSVAPSGKGSLTIHCPATLDSHEVWHTEAGRKRGAAYRAFKQQFADILIQRVEESFAPGLRSHIEFMEVATPVTYWRYTGNANGSIMGTRPTGRNIRARISRSKTPVRNLLVAGHWANYGGGLPVAMQTGANAALLILNERRPADGQILKNVMDGRLKTDVR
jgi:prolycopene isomerase